MFETIVNADGTISIVPVGQTNDLPFTSMVDMAAKNANLDFFPAPQDLYTGAIANNPTYLMKQQLGMVPTGITASSAASTFGTPEDIEQGFVKGSPSDTSFSPLGIDTSFGVANEPDEEEETKSGIIKLLEFLTPGSMLSNVLPKSDPRAVNMRNFYGSQYGLTPTGSVASGS